MAQTAVTRSAAEILGRQCADGAIVMGRMADTNNRVLPYFGNLAALGLVKTFGGIPERTYLEAAKRWAQWYAAHMDTDGTVTDYVGEPANWHSTGSYDSSDSYAASYLELLSSLSSHDQPWMRAHYHSVERAVSALERTLQTNGLTLSKPGWPVMYTMDNVEVVRGWRAAAGLARLAAHPKEAQTWGRRAIHAEAALERELWASQASAYLIGIQTNGARLVAGDRWYPDQMANLMAIGWGRASERNRALYHRLRSKPGATVPRTVNTEDELDRLVWWGYAAEAAEDKVLGEQIRGVLATFDPKTFPVVNTALLGHVCRLLTSKTATSAF